MVCSFVSGVTLLVLLVLALSIRIPYQMKHKNQVIKDDSYNRGFEKFITVFQMVPTLLAPIFAVLSIMSMTPSVLEMPLPFWLWIISVVIGALSVLLFFFVHKELGKNWSPMLEIQDDQKLVDTGIYRHIRHPMYTEMWMWSVCQGLILQNWLLTIISTVSWGLLYFTRVPKEEKMLVELFGKDYEEYMKTTGRIFPKFFGRKD